MSEWVDFGLYSLQAVMLWIVVPYWGVRHLRPAQPHGGAWLKVMQAWGVLSVLALLRANGWQSMLRISTLLLVPGVLLAGCGVWAFLRSLKGSEPEQQAEPIFALSRDELLPRVQQYWACGLMLLALLARPVAGAFWPVRNIWGNFFTGLAAALLLFVLAAGSVMRPSNIFDRVLGPRYRQMEVRLCYVLMGCLALLQMAGLSLELAVLASRRYGALLVSAFVSLTLASFMLLSSPDKEKGPAVSSRP